MEDQVAAAPEAASLEPWPFPRRLVAAFTSPRALFERLAQRPSWFAPLALLLVLVLLYIVILWNPVMLPESLAKAAESPRGAAATEQFMSTVGRIIIPCFAVGATMFFTVLYALCVWIVGGFVLGGTLTFRQSLSLVTHASLVGIPGFLLRIPLALISNSSQVTVGPGMLFPAAQAEGFGGHFLSAFLAGFDVFNLWSTALLALGVSVVARVPSGKANAGIWTLYGITLIAGGLLAGGFSLLGPH
jgi:hypothetical protein